MTKLSANLNKVATLRNQRDIGIPSVVRAARMCLDAGAHGITVHPRPDERHIRTGDVYELAEVLKSYPHAEYNIEGNPFLGEYMKLARDVRPTQCTLVPDDPSQKTSDHGYQLTPQEMKTLPAVVKELQSLGCRVSLFMDANIEPVPRAKSLGVDRIELYTEPYAAGFVRGDRDAAAPFAITAREATKLGLALNAGHDLNLANLPRFLKAVPNVLEVSIGHALIADALEFGLPETVRKYLKACSSH